jgi:hypothetical protein
MGVQEFPNLSLKSQDLDRLDTSPFLFEGPKNAADRLQTKRSLIQWQLPHLGSNQFLEMYVNPQNIQFSSRKEINKIRTKGGFIAQYWGEDLDTINIQGTTASSGIEGINALRDIYRSEQLALIEIVTRTSLIDKRRQSLMQLAASVVMWYQGQGYRGYFLDMNYTESVGTLGLFDYVINFQVTETLGNRRKNFLPWHRHPWSTTETPNQSNNQNATGGGYGEGNKVGALNIPPFDNKLGEINDERKPGKPRVIKLAILRADPKDGTIVKTVDGDSFTGSDSGRKAENVKQTIIKAFQKPSGDFNLNPNPNRDQLA